MRGNIGSAPWLRTLGSRIVTEAGQPVVLRGVGVGGWLNMENFITGYPATESLQREAMRKAMGDEAYRAFFDRFTECFFGPEDAGYLASLGFNCVRIPVNYRHLTSSDGEPSEAGLALLEGVVAMCAGQGLYTILDLHALPGGQNPNWHSDNPVHRAALWEHQVLQDQVTALWTAIAARFHDEAWVAGYNPVNEPVDPGGTALAAFYARLVAAIRQADPRHILFLDGNRYATDFSVFDDSVFPGAVSSDGAANIVYDVHDYALPGMEADSYPGTARGEWFDSGALERVFLARTEFMRRTGTPIWVGEFGPWYTGDPAVDDARYAVLADQLEIYAAHGASWSLWTYKDLGLQGLVTVAPDSPYLRRIAPVLAKKRRLGTDSWGGTDRQVRHIMEPIERLFDEEFPDFRPYPWGARPWIARIVRQILLAEPLAEEFGRSFAGADAAEPARLAGSFAFAACERNERLAALMRAATGAGRTG